jgi:ubiquitin C-terminal hydrolase
MADWETQLIDGHEPFVNGLDNPTGSTCYVNSVLQAIFSMKNLVLTLGNEEVVQDVRELVSFNTENEYKLFRWFSILIERCWENGEADGIYKKFMKACFKSCQDRFLPNQQEDSCEFLLFMLEDIGNTFNDLIAYFNNEPVLTFGFEAEFFPTIRKITIYECQHQSMREERELLVVYPSNKGILTDCIKDSIRPVYFDPCECKDGIHDPASRCQALLCSECNEYVSGVIHQKVIRFPSTLLVNIRLFEATQERVSYFF